MLIPIAPRVTMIIFNVLIIVSVTFVTYVTFFLRKSYRDFIYRGYVVRPTVL